MRFKSPTLLLGMFCIALSPACTATRSVHLRSNALEYLYPEGKPHATPARSVQLKVPVRVGLAFAPSARTYADPFTEVQKQHLLTRIAEAFRGKDFIASLEVLPSTYVTQGGSFQELDRLASAFGLDLMALISYDQRQFTETTNASLTYLTVVGAFAIQGEKNETHTLMDTVVYDIPSRALLFRSAGESSLKARSTPVTVDRAMRRESEESFERATDDLIGNLETALQAFREQVKSGTIRGEGTPAVEIVRATGGGGGGAGTLGGPDLIIAAALACAFWCGRRRGASWGRSR